MKSFVTVAGGFLFLVLCACSNSSGQLVEGFDNVMSVEPPLTEGEIVPGWLVKLRSDQRGLTGAYNEGDPPFGQHSGDAFSVINMNFNNALLEATDTTSTWLISPELTMNNGDTISFWTRTASNSMYPDRLLLRLSTSGASTDVGEGAMDVGDFDTVLVDINPNNETGVYPETFTEIVATVSGLSGTTQGRVALHYFNQFMDVNGNNIAIDTFEYALGGFVAPAEFFVSRGIELNGSLSDYSSSDDVSARYNPGFTISSTEPPVWIQFDGNASTATGFLVESHASTPGLEYTVDAFNWGSGLFETIGVQSESFGTDQVVTFPVVGGHIDGDGSVRSRVGWRAIGFTIAFPWEVRIDQTGWNQ